MSVSHQSPPTPPAAALEAPRSQGASPWERADAVGHVAPLLARIQDPVERGEFARQLALAVGTEPHDVEAAVRRELRGGSGSDDDVPEPGPRRETPEDRP